MKHRTPIAVVIVCGVYLSSSLVSSQDDAGGVLDATTWTVYDAVADYVAEVDQYADPTARDQIVGVAQFWDDTFDWYDALDSWSTNLSAEDAARVDPALDKLRDALTTSETMIRDARLHWLNGEPYEGLFDALAASAELGQAILIVDGVLGELFPPAPPVRAATPLPATSERTPARVLQLLNR